MTVGSLAIRATRRPSIVGQAGDDAVGAQPLLSQLASSPSSAKEPGSTRRSTRSRTGSLPCSAVFSWWRCGPPARAASRAFANSVTAAAYSPWPACQSTGPARSTWAPSGRPSTSCAAREASIRRGRSIPVSIAHLVQHRDHVLAGDVAGRARRHRAAAQLAEARLEGLDPLLQRRQHVGEALAAGVVEVGGQLDPAEALAGGGEELVHLARVRHPGGVAEADLLAAGRGEPLGDLEDPLGRHLALVGAAEGGRDHALAAQARPRRRVASVGSSPASDSSTERLTLRRLWVSEAERKTLISSKRSRISSARSRPRSLGIRTEKETPSRRWTAASTSLGVGELRDHVGAHEGGHLDPPQAARREQVDQPHLVGGGDRLRLVLEAVAGADLADADAAGQLGHRPGAYAAARGADLRHRRRAETPRSHRAQRRTWPGLVARPASWVKRSGVMPAAVWAWSRTWSRACWPGCGGSAGRRSRPPAPAPARRSRPRTR